MWVEILGASLAQHPLLPLRLAASRRLSQVCRVWRSVAARCLAHAYASVPAKPWGPVDVDIPTPRDLYRSLDSPVPRWLWGLGTRGSLPEWHRVQPVATSTLWAVLRCDVHWLETSPMVQGCSESLKVWCTPVLPLWVKVLGPVTFRDLPPVDLALLVTAGDKGWTLGGLLDAFAKWMEATRGCGDWRRLRVDCLQGDAKGWCIVLVPVRQ